MQPFAVIPGFASGLPPVSFFGDGEVEDLNTVTSVNVASALPAGTQAGDVCVISSMIAQSDAFTSPTGFVAATSIDWGGLGETKTSGVMVGVLTVAQLTTLTVSWTVGSQSHHIVSIYRNARSAAVAASGSANAATGVNVAYTKGADCIGIVAVHHVHSASSNNITNFTTREEDLFGLNHGYHIQDLLTPSSYSGPNVEFAADGATDQTAFVVELRR